MSDAGISDRPVEEQLNILTGWLAAAQERGDHYREQLAAKNAQLAAITTARDEAAVAYAERVRMLREALDDFREYALRPDGDAVWVGGSHHNPIWARVAAALEATK
jgi:hypothetical protein